MICVDASVAVKWILEEEYTEQALDLYFTSLRVGESIIAPHLMPIEVTNIVRQRMRKPDGPSLEEAMLLLDKILAFPITLLNPDGLHQRALAIAHAYGLPAAFDAHYLALSEFSRCELWTDDRRLLRQIGPELPFVRWLGDYAPDARE